MKKHKNKNFKYNRLYIFSSDADIELPVELNLYAEIDCFGRLVVCVVFSSDKISDNCSISAIVNRDDSHQMARRHGIKHALLPQLIAESMADWGCCGSFGRVMECFKEITERLLDENCRFKIVRTDNKRSSFHF